MEQKDFEGGNSQSEEEYESVKDNNKKVCFANLWVFAILLHPPRLDL